LLDRSSFHPVFFFRWSPLSVLVFTCSALVSCLPRFRSGKSIFLARFFSYPIIFRESDSSGLVIPTFLAVLAFFPVIQNHQLVLLRRNFPQWDDLRNLPPFLGALPVKLDTPPPSSELSLEIRLRFHRVGEVSFWVFPLRYPWVGLFFHFRYSPATKRKSIHSETVCIRTLLLVSLPPTPIRFALNPTFRFLLLPRFCAGFMTSHP